MSDIKFPKGLFANKPHANAPNFVIGSLNINRDEFIGWLKTQPEKVNLDIKESREGKYYTSVNEWKPKDQNVEPPSLAAPPSPFEAPINEDDIPY